MIWPIFRYLKIDSIYALIFKSDLKKIGWFKSYTSQSSVDLSGNPLPWITYPSIRFLENRISINMQIFEYGSGNSTLWFAKKAKFVTSVEHNHDWYEYTKKKIPKNVELLYHSMDSVNYVKCLTIKNNKYDIIFIDGRRRVDCLKEAVDALTPNGCVVLDNSERNKYSEGINFLEDRGFKKLDFWGLAPINVQISCTSIFYREDNSLNI